MANNYTQATLYPELSKTLFTEKELDQLECAGFTYEEMHSGELYFFVEDSFMEQYTDDLGEDFNIYDIFQNVIKRSLESTDEEDIHEIALEGAYTCSKMRPGEFGGFVARVTKDNVQFGSTSELLQRMREDNLTQ